MTEVHNTPPTDSDARQHELTPDCWCDPVGVTVWEGTQYEKTTYQHFSPSVPAEER